MREIVYLSKRKLAMFYPERAPRSVQFTGSLGVGPAFAKVDVSKISSGADENTLLMLDQTIKYLEREAVHFSSPELNPGRWIFFDLNMGYGTSYRDSGIPPEIDDVVLFYGSSDQIETDKQSPLDLLLCGSTEHLLTKTASAGRMGSGTEWLYDLIGETEVADALGDGELPSSLSPDALAVRRVNMPQQVARWVFDVIRWHHAPAQYAQMQGFARILFVVPATEYTPRLVLATPLFVQFASSKPIGILARRRMQREVSRRHGLRWRKWRPNLAPHDRARVYTP